MAPIGSNNQDMTNATNVEVLRPRIWSALPLLGISLTFVVIGLCAAQSNPWMGLLCAGFFGLGIPLALIQLLPGSTYLRIDDEGLTTCTMYRETKIPWAAIEDFGVVIISHNKMVGLNYVESYDRSRGMRQMAAAISGCEGALPNTYGMRADQLAEKLTARLGEYRQRTQHPLE